MAKTPKTKKVKVNRSTANKKGSWALGDLKGAAYNPRHISKKRLDDMGNSYDTFGDLSGVVLNRRSGLLVSGHQRTRLIEERGYKTKIETKAHKDKFGTVELGHLHVKSEDGVYSIPFRVVDWDEDTFEKAANIAANAHGGDFDKEKLASLVAELDPNSVEIETTGLDPLTLRSLPAIGGAGKAPSSEQKGGKGAERNGAGGSFKEFTDDSVKDELQHKCPRCQFRF